MADIAVSVCVVVTYLVVHALSKLGAIVDLVLENLEHVGVDFSNCVALLEYLTSARSLFHRSVKVRRRLEHRHDSCKFHLDKLAILSQ